MHIGQYFRALSVVFFVQEIKIICLENYSIITYFALVKFPSKLFEISIASTIVHILFCLYMVSIVSELCILISQRPL